MAVLETRARGEVPAVVGQRPGTGGQGNGSECEHSSPFPRPPACTRGERRPHHSFILFISREGQVSLSLGRKARRNRRAPGASSGGKHGDDGRLRPEMPCFPPGAAIVRSPTVPPPIAALQHQEDYLRLSALSAVSSVARVGGLRVCDVLLCVFLCALCASVVLRADGRQIRNSKFEI
jgi:hypothetical protein